MGTRAAIGFRVNGQDKITYNHFDGYPTGLGMSAITQLIEYANDVKRLVKNDPEHGVHISLAELTVSNYDVARKNVESIVMVDDDVKPTAEQIEQNRDYLNLDVNAGTEETWYCLLRGAQGNITDYLTGKLGVMIDSAGFMNDSLFCEWAYIFNFDTNRLEIYQGFNKTCTNGRYAPIDSDSEYRPVALMVEVGFSILTQLTSDQIRAICVKLEEIQIEGMGEAQIIEEIEDMTSLKLTA